jgi:hypothetical protein
MKGPLLFCVCLQIIALICLIFLSKKGWKPKFAWNKQEVDTEIGGWCVMGYFKWKGKYIPEIEFLNCIKVLDNLIDKGKKGKIVYNSRCVSLKIVYEAYKQVPEDVQCVVKELAVWVKAISSHKDYKEPGPYIYQPNPLLFKNRYGLDSSNPPRGHR